MHPFSFSAECIAASTTVSEGPGWKAVIEGTYQVSREKRMCCMAFIGRG